MAFDIDLSYLCPIPKGKRELPDEEDVWRLCEAIKYQVFKPTFEALAYIDLILERFIEVSYYEEEGMDTPYCAPCPHCGEEMEPTYGGDRRTIIGFQHPPVEIINGKASCMPGHHVGIALLDVWNMRDGEVPEGIEMVAPDPIYQQFYMEIRKDEAGRDYPIFNTTGATGTPVTIDMINDTLMWYKSKAES